MDFLYLEVLGSCFLILGSGNIKFLHSQVTPRNPLREKC
ncbi:MAG: hypothetical protein KatS3mg050_3524 [Litorilinea sp.]|nr:MAG: hypothetical protein KatS3mg050_3524 [Litorilinea sp.]